MLTAPGTGKAYQRNGGRDNLSLPLYYEITKKKYQMRIHKYYLKFFAVLVAISAAYNASADKRAFTISDLYRVKSIYGISLSHATDCLAATVNSMDLGKHASSSSIVTMDTKAKTPKLDTLKIKGKGWGAFWSADGSHIYYSAVSDSGVVQLFAYDIKSHNSKQITDFALGVSSPLVSPNSRYVAFVSSVYPDLGADGEKNLQRIKKRNAGPVRAHLADKLLFRHWTEYSDGRVQHIIIYDTETKQYRDLTPGEFVSPVFSPSGAEGGFCFSPDSREICYTSNHSLHPEANTNCDLFTVSVDGGETKCLTAENKAWDGSPSYSPDGKWIAYRMQTVESYESDRFRIALIDRTTGEKRVLTENFDNWTDDYKWASDSRSIFFIADERGYNPLYSVDIRSLKIRSAIPSRSIREFCIGRDGNVYYTYSTVGKPSALYVRKLYGSEKTERQLSFLNAALEAETDIRPAEKMRVAGAAGDSVDVFIVKPHGFDPSKKYPLIVNVHGGPQMQWSDSFRGDWQVYPGAGYIVAFPNPHGSTGYGQAFTRAISGDWGGKPYEDVIKVTEALEKLHYVDTARMGAMGWSYGGYFMNWLQGHPHPFKCLASMMGLFDLSSMWGTTEELWFPNFDLQGQPWNSPLYRKFSPSSYISAFRTPTLIITGEKDYRVSYTQSLQYFSTLQTLGIPSRLIVFERDGHWPSTLNSMPVYYNAHLEWFHKYLGGAPAPWRTEDMVNNAADVK